MIVQQFYCDMNIIIITQSKKLSGPINQEQCLSQSNMIIFVRFERILSLWTIKTSQIYAQSFLTQYIILKILTKLIEPFIYKVSFSYLFFFIYFSIFIHFHIYININQSSSNSNKKHQMVKVVQSCIQHEGNALFYEATLRQRIATVDLFDREGIKKLSRNIRMPKGVTQLYCTRQYLIGVNQQHTLISVCNVLNMNQDIMINDLNLQSGKNGSKLELFYYDNNLNLILFVQDSKNIYEICLEASEITVEFLYTSDHAIDKLQVDHQENLCLLIKLKKILLKVQIDWTDQAIIKQEVTQNVVDFCFRDGWDLLITEQIQQKRVQQKFNFKTRNKGCFMGSVDVSGDQLIFTSEISVILIDQTTRVIIMINNGEMYKFTSISKPNKKFKQNSTFISVVKNQIEETLVIRLLTYRGEMQKFDEFKYDRLKIFQNLEKQQSREINNFFVLQKQIKTHISRIFQSNGLIYPNFLQIASKFIKCKFIKKNSKKSQQIKQQVIQMNEQDLSYNLFSILVKQYQTQIRLLVASVLKNKDIYLQNQLTRFLKYINRIINHEVSFIFKKYVQNMKERNQMQMRDQREMDEELLSSSQEEKHKEIQTIKRTLVTLIKILQSFIRQIQFECVLQNGKNSISSRGISENISLFIGKSAQTYKTTLSRCHSFYLVLDLIEQNKTLHEINAFFKSSATVRAININLQKQFCKQINPLLPFEYFYTISFLGYEQLPRYQSFIQYLLTNLERFQQIAYFYVNLKYNSIEIQQSSRFYPFISDPLRKYLLLVKKVQFLQKLPNSNSNSILTQLTKLALQLKYYPFLKFVCQLTVRFDAFNLCNLILSSGALQITRPQLYRDQQQKNEDIFIIKAYVSCRKFQNCFCWILKKFKFDQGMVSELIRRMVQNGEFRNVQRLKIHIHNKPYVDFVNEILQRHMQVEDFKTLQELVPSQMA